MVSALVPVLVISLWNVSHDTIWGHMITALSTALYLLVALLTKYTELSTLAPAPPEAAWPVPSCSTHMHTECPLSLQLTKNMGGVVKGLDKVMQSMDLEKVSSGTCQCVPLLLLHQPLPLPFYDTIPPSQIGRAHV